MFAFVFINSVLGLFFGHYFLSQRVRLKQISKEQSSRLLMIYVLYLFVLVWVSSQFKTLLLFLILLPVLGAFVYFFVLKKIYERRFRRRFPAFLDLLIMRVHMGTSIKESLKITLAYEPSYFQNIMVRVLDLAQYDELRGEKRGYFLLKLVQVFYKIEQQPHQALRIFENLRYQLKLENYFRHKSGQLTKQVWLQVYILAAMYLALLVFVLKFYNKQNYQPFLFPSFSLFIVGVMALFYLGRKRKWKV